MQACAFISYNVTAVLLIAAIQSTVSSYGDSLFIKPAPEPRDIVRRALWLSVAILIPVFDGVQYVLFDWIITDMEQYRTA